MVTKGLLVRLEAKPGKDMEVEEFLLAALPMVRQEAGTSAWFAIRFGRSEYGIFDVFPDDASREMHLSGPVARALVGQADSLFAEPPRIQKLDVLADKLPATPPNEPDTKGLILTFEAKEVHQQEVEQFLREAQLLVAEEPKTIAWFAIRLDGGVYGIFDVFPDNGGRLNHLTGHVTKELVKHALSLLGGMPEMELLNILAEKLAEGVAAAKA